MNKDEIKLESIQRKLHFNRLHEQYLEMRNDNEDLEQEVQHLSDCYYNQNAQLSRTKEKYHDLKRSSHRSIKNLTNQLRETIREKKEMYAELTHYRKTYGHYSPEKKNKRRVRSNSYLKKSSSVDELETLEDREVFNTKSRAVKEKLMNFKTSVTGLKSSLVEMKNDLTKQCDVWNFKAILEYSQNGYLYDLEKRELKEKVAKLEQTIKDNELRFAKKQMRLIKSLGLISERSQRNDSKQEKNRQVITSRRNTVM